MQRKKTTDQVDTDPTQQEERRVFKSAEKNPRLIILFRGLFALVPSSNLSKTPKGTEPNPSSVSLLFPYAGKSDTKVNDELGLEHPFPANPDLTFDPHKLTFKYGYLQEISKGGKLTNYAFQPLTERNLPPYSEIVFYDGEAKPENEINSPSLLPKDPSREEDLKAIKYSTDPCKPYQVDLEKNVVDMNKIYSDEENYEDKNLKAKSMYLDKDYFDKQPTDEKEQLIARILRLRGGTLNAFNGLIAVEGKPGTEETINKENTYTFQKHLYGGEEYTIEASDTIVFERELTNGTATVSVKYGGPPISNKYTPHPEQNNICLLIEHVAKGNMNTYYDYDYALTYRVADLFRVDGSEKLRKIPAIKPHQEGGGASICGLALYTSHPKA